MSDSLKDKENQRARMGRHLTVLGAGEGLERNKRNLDPRRAAEKLFGYWEEDGPELSCLQDPKENPKN